MVSEELEAMYSLPSGLQRGRYLLAFDPLDGSSNVDVNISVGSIFSVLLAPDQSRAARAEDFFCSPARNKWPQVMRSMARPPCWC